MLTRLIILNGSGDTKITWDHTNPDECTEARRIVANLKDKGFSFFLVDGSPADEVAAGGGMLVVRKLTADEVIASETESEAIEPEPTAETAEQLGLAPETDPAKKRRGRPPKVGSVPGPTPAPNAKTVVAVRPLRGG